MVQKGAHTKKAAQKMQKAYQKKGYKLVRIHENPKKFVGKGKTSMKKYTVNAQSYRKPKKK